MPFRAPSAARMPPLDFLLADQMAPPEHIARHLGESRRSLQRWRASGNAPRTVYLALWSSADGTSLNCTRNFSTRRGTLASGSHRWSVNATA
ncbi:MAG TPA: hypothetical protein VIP27_04640 [Variovorax sp.]